MNKKIKMSVKLFMLSIIVLFGFSASPLIPVNNAMADYAVPSCTSATLNGFVNTNGNTTTAWFEWGTTSSLGYSTAHQTFNYPSPFSSEITNLTENTIYYFRAMAQSVAGTATGSIISFRTNTCTPPPATNPTALVTASASTITSGNSVTVYWTSTNATYCTSSPNSWSGGSATSGHSILWPTQTTTYSVTCYGANGTTPATDSVTITVNPVTPPVTNPTAYLTASSSTITVGNSSTLYWTSTNATSCTLSWNSGNHATYGSQAVWPTSTTNYSITCYGASGTTPAMSQTTVTVNPATPPVTNPTAYLTASSSTITVGNSSTLYWTSTNANTCNLSWNNNNHATYGSEGVWPTQTTTYSVTCYGASGTTPATDSVTVTVNPVTPPVNNPTALVTASASTITLGSSVTLYWTSTNATSCSSSPENWTNGSAPSGHSVLWPTVTTTYWVNCYGATGTPPATDHVTVTVTQPNQNPPLSCSGPTTVTAGTTATFSASGGTSPYNWSEGNNTFNGTVWNLFIPSWYSGQKIAHLYDAAGGNDDCVFTVTQNQTNQNPTVSLTANPVSIQNGQNSTLTWISQNATWCSSYWTSNTATSGSGVVVPTTTTTYSITCYGASGTTPATAQATVYVNQNPPVNNNPTAQLTADSLSVNYGGSTTLRWNSTYTSYCDTSVTAGGASGWNGRKGTSGTFPTGALTATATYYLSCMGTNGQLANDSLTITVGNPPATPSGHLLVSPSSCVISAGQSTCTVTGATWNTSNVNDPRLFDRNTGALLSTLANNYSPLTVWVAYPYTTFDLKNGSTVLDTKVANASCTSGTTWNGNVCMQNQAQNPTVNIYANPTSIAYGGTIYLTWGSSNTNSCTASSSPYNSVWTGAKSLNGNNVAINNLTSTTTFSIICYNNAGQSATDSVTVNVGGQVQNPTVYITANPMSVSYEGTTYLTWNSNNTVSCTASSSPYNSAWTGAKSLSGNNVAISNLTSTTTFNITCSNNAGQSASDSVTVGVGNPPATPSGHLLVSPSSCVISAGQSTCTVTGATWNTSNVNDPRLFDRNTGALLSTLANNYSPLTVWVAYPYTTFDLKNGSTVLDTKVANASCTSGTTWNGNVCAQNQVQNPTVSITANPMSVNYNGTSVISWTSANATSCVGNGGSNGWSGSKNLSGTFSTGALTNTTSYSIICTNSSGQSAVDSVTVSVGNQNQNPTVNITANPTSIQMGQSSILSWSSANANSCTTSTGNSGTSGNQTVYPSVTTNYSITCYGNNGTQAADQVTVYVNQIQNQTCQDPSANNYGGLLPCTYYNQICQDVNAINYRGSLPCRYNTYNYVCQDPSAINYRGTLPCQYNTYIYTCQDTRATNYGAILPCRYNIYFDNRPTVGIAADSTDLAWNRPTNIRWYTTNATSCYASDGSFGWAGVKSIGPGSFYTGSLTSSKVYTITCTNAYGSATDSVRVNVRGQVINPVTPVAPTSYVIINSSVDRNQPIVPTIDNTRPHPGDQINYTVSYQNIGNASITGLTLRITLPYEVDYMFSNPSNPVITGNVLTFNLGTLKANGQGSVTVRVRVKDNTPLGTVLNFPAVLSYTDPSGNIQSVSANVTAQVWSGDVNTDNSINRNTDNNINLGANVFGAGFWPSNLFGWLIFLVLLLLLILLILYIYEKIRNSRTAKKTPSAPKPVMVKKTTTTTTTPQQ